ncbi:MAG: hypothetical protein LBC97_04110, partial [Bifidobacteriaceae bacterium]|nr:hypothetical protein [Bifidobacteriaceae bacterium]
MNPVNGEPPSSGADQLTVTASPSTAAVGAAGAAGTVGSGPGSGVEATVTGLDAGDGSEEPTAFAATTVAVQEPAGTSVNTTDVASAAAAATSGTPNA